MFASSTISPKVEFLDTEQRINRQTERRQPRHASHRQRLPTAASRSNDHPENRTRKRHCRINSSHGRHERNEHDLSGPASAIQLHRLEPFRTVADDTLEIHRRVLHVVGQLIALRYLFQAVVGDWEGLFNHCASILATTVSPLALPSSWRQVLYHQQHVHLPCTMRECPTWCFSRRFVGSRMVPRAG